MTLRRSIVMVVLAAGLFGGSTAAGFLLAKGALRHAPSATALPRAPEASRFPATRYDTTGAGGSTPAGTRGGTGPAHSGAAALPAVPPPPAAAGGAPPAVATQGALTPGGAAGPPAATSVPEAVPSKPSPDAGTRPPDAAPVVPGRFHVQVAAFPERQNAQAVALRLRARGYAVTVTDGPPYRVWVGGYLDQATAERLAAYLRQRGLSPALVPQ